MISGHVGGLQGLDDIMRDLERYRNPQLMPLALDIKQAIVEGNREGLLAGTDAGGAPMAELKESTVRERVRREGGFGPPTIPRNTSSQLIDRFRAEIEPAGEGFRIRAGWIGVPQVKYFKTGTRNMVARNPVGIRPATRQKINELVAAFKRKLVARP
jgi:hypothetical protein